MFHKFRTKKFLISSFLIIAFVALFFAIVNFALFKASNVQFLNKILQKKYGIVLNSDEINTSYSGLHVNVSSPKIVLLNKNTNHEILSVSDLSLRVDVLPFLIGKLFLDECSASELIVDLTRNKDGSFPELDIFSSDKKMFKTDFSKLQLSIGKYDIKFNDLYVKNKFFLNGFSFVASGLNPKKKFFLNTEGNLQIINNEDVKISPFLVDIDFVKSKKKASIRRQNIIVSNFDTSFLKNYLKDKGFVKTQAVVDIYTSSADDSDYSTTYIYLNGLDYAFNYKNELNRIKSNSPVILAQTALLNQSNLLIKDASIKTQGVDVYYFGKLNNIFDLKKFSSHLNVKINNTQLRNFVELFPDTAIPFQEPYIKNLKLYNAHAIVNGEGEVKFSDSENFSVDGKLDFEDVFVVERPKNAQTSYGECEFKGRDVKIKVFANTPNGVVLTVFGDTKMQKLPYAEFDIATDGKIDMEFAHKILIPVQKILALKLGPLPYMTLKGNGEIKLHTKGNRLDSKLYGWFESNDATVTLNGLNTILTKGSVKILFNESDIVFDGAKGVIEGAKAYIDGNSNTKGDMDIKVKILDLPAKKAINVAKTSTLVTSALDGGEFLNSFKPQSGNIDFDLHLYGNVPPDAEFGAQSDTVFSEGKIDFKGVDLIVEPKIKGTKLFGSLNFDKATNFDLKCNIFDSPFKITGTVAQKTKSNRIIHGVPSILNIRFISDDVKSVSLGNFILDNLELFVPQNRLFAQNLGSIFKSSKFKVKGDIKAEGLIYPNNTQLDLSGFSFDGYVAGINTKGSDFNFKRGTINLKDKDVKFDKLHILADGVDISLDGCINKFASLKPFNNLKIAFGNSSFLSYIKMFSKTMSPKNQKTISLFGDFSGSVSGKINLFGDKIDGAFFPSNISFTDLKTQRKVVLNDGKIRIKNNKTYLTAFNALYGDLPIFADGFIQTDGDINPEFNIFATTNLNEKACDELLNPYLKYPLAITGEVLAKGRLQGRLNSYTTYLSLILNEGSDLSYMGLKLGDVDHKREIASKISLGGSFAEIKYIRYFKYILSQNNKQTPYDLIKISGGIKSSGDEFSFVNFRALTPNPAPVRFLNPIFKKSLIKDGVFTSNIVLNGKPDNIKATGNLEFSNVSIPLYDSNIDNIRIDLNKKTGKAEFKVSMFDTVGDVVMDFENKAQLPVVINNVSIHSDSVSIDNFMKSFASVVNISNQTSTSAAGQNQFMLSPSDIQVKKGNLNVDKITFNGIEATNLKMNFSHSKDAELKIDDTYLAIAGGLINGSGVYNFDSRSAAVSSVFMNCDANELAKAFFNLSGQIYGNANGKFDVSLKDFTPSDYVQKINAQGDFEIINGKLPKLGSIEYLLRASSLFKGGIFGLTLNGVIELLKPYRHGDFNKISGNFKIADASIQDLKLYSQGDNLSTYTYGSYNILDGIAHIEILGKLSKKVSTLLGPIGNTSLVSILNVVTRNKMNELVKTEMLKNVNKIPLIDLNNDDYRLFNVKLEGPATAEDVVKSFTWLN